MIVEGQILPLPAAVPVVSEEVQFTNFQVLVAAGMSATPAPARRDGQHESAAARNVSQSVSRCTGH